MSPGGNICTLASRKGLFSTETLSSKWPGAGVGLLMVDFGNEKVWTCKADSSLRQEGEEIEIEENREKLIQKY